MIKIHLKDLLCYASYVADTYNFYLFPKSFNFCDNLFTFQASAFEFLARHNFDFNKFVFNGISFINNDQEQALRQKIEKQIIFSGIER